MTATVSDFIAATGFSLRDAVALSDASLNLTNPKQDVVPSPPVLPQGIRFSVADGTNTDYYRVGLNVTGSIVAGGMDWVGVDIHPAAVRAYASGLSVTFHPFVSPKGFAPSVTVKAHETTSVNLLDYFEMVGGRDADLSFVARPGGAEAQLAVSGSSLTVAGRTNGTMTASISAHDRAQGVATRTFSFVVLPANRPPQSDRAIGNPSVGVGATRVYDLSLYFSDPDVDTLTYTVTGATSQTAAAAAVSGTELTIGGHSTGSTTLVITASDGTLDISQQVHVTVPPNRRPVRVAHVEPVALNLGGPTVTRDIADAFTDPDGGTLSWLVQYEEGDPGLQFMQEFWHVVSKQGSNLLNLESLFAYPGTTPPWSATLRPWVIPAGTDFAFRNGTPSVLTRGTLLSTATVRWDSGAGRVKVAIRTTDALPAAAISPPSRLLLGPDADVAWVEGDQTDTGLVNFLPGASPGSRTGYIEVWDAGSLFASDLFNIALGQRPTAKPVPAQTLFTGAGVTIPLADHFTDPDGDALTYTVTVSRPHYVTTALIPRQTSGLPGATYAPGSSWFDVDLRIHGQTVGDVVVTVVATDAIGLTETLDIAVTIEASSVLGRAPLISRDRTRTLIQDSGEPVVLTGGATNAQYELVGIVETGSLNLGESAAGLSFAVAAPVLVTIADIDFQTLAAPDRALLSLDNLNRTVTQVQDGIFEFRGERYLIESVESIRASAHVLARRYTLQVLVQTAGTVPAATPQRPTFTVPELQYLVNSLLDDPAVFALIGNRIWLQRAPADAPLPFVLAVVTHVELSQTFGGERRLYAEIVLAYFAVDAAAVSAGIPPIKAALSALTLLTDEGNATFANGFWSWQLQYRVPSSILTGSTDGNGNGGTPPVPPAPVETLRVNTPRPTASHEAGATAATVDVAAWFSATNVTGLTYALSSAPSWITLSGSTLTIAPGASITAKDYTATITASGTVVSDVTATLTVTVTPVVVGPDGSWTVVHNYATPTAGVNYVPTTSPDTTQGSTYPLGARFTIAPTSTVFTVIAPDSWMGYFTAASSSTPHDIWVLKVSPTLPQGYPIGAIVTWV